MKRASQPNENANEKKKWKICKSTIKSKTKCCEIYARLSIISLCVCLVGRHSILWFYGCRLSIETKFSTKNKLSLWRCTRDRSMCVRCVNNNELFSWVHAVVDHCIVLKWFNLDLPLEYVLEKTSKTQNASKTNKPTE